jgi:hypothetical protein
MLTARRLPLVRELGTAPASPRDRGHSAVSRLLRKLAVTNRVQIGILVHDAALA